MTNYYWLTTECRGPGHRLFVCNTTTSTTTAATTDATSYLQASTRLGPQ